MATTTKARHCKCQGCDGTLIASEVADGYGTCGVCGCTYNEAHERLLNQSAHVARTRRLEDADEARKKAEADAAAAKQPGQVPPLLQFFDVLASSPAPRAITRRTLGKSDELSAFLRAVVKAQASAQAVVKDSLHDKYGYAYASAESIIEEGKRVMSQHALMLMPLESEIATTKLSVVRARASGTPGPELGFEAVLVETWLFLHEQGGGFELVRRWPISCEDGRSFPKALAAASTSLNAYLIRGLLQLPRRMPGEDERFFEAPPAIPDELVNVHPDVAAFRAEKVKLEASAHEQRLRGWIEEVLGKLKLEPDTLEHRHATQMDINGGRMPEGEKELAFVLRGLNERYKAKVATEGAEAAKAALVEGLPR